MRNGRIAQSAFGMDCIDRIASDLVRLMAANQGCVALKQKLCTLSSMAGDLHKHWLFPIPKAHFQVLGYQLDSTHAYAEINGPQKARVRRLDGWRFVEPARARPS